MKPNLAEDVERRRLLCKEAAAELGLEPASIEKDFWLCRTLRELVGIPELGLQITFKGGTSLSKGFRLIERFSEDLDLVLGREHLGFGGDRSPEQAGISGKERERRLDALRSAARSWVESKALPSLTAAIRAAIGAASLDLTIDPEDPDRQTVLFRYPNAFDVAGYIRPVVKLEFGARSDTEPVLRPEIRSYLSETLPDAAADDAFRIRTVAPRRTFWEKAMLLHEEGYRVEGAVLKGRLSRHLYDLSCLIRAGVGREAMEDPALFDAVAAHRRVFFGRNRSAHDSRFSRARSASYRDRSGAMPGPRTTRRCAARCSSASRRPSTRSCATSRSSSGLSTRRRHDHSCPARPEARATAGLRAAREVLATLLRPGAGRVPVRTKRGPRS